MSYFSRRDRVEYAAGQRLAIRAAAARAALETVECTVCGARAIEVRHLAGDVTDVTNWAGRCKAHQAPRPASWERRALPPSTTRRITNGISATALRRRLLNLIAN